jgi:uncharacterized DUF497 family protein
VRRYAWHPAKRATNLARHGIDFADVPPVFDGPLLELRDDRADYGEERWLAVGLLGDVEVAVVYVDDGDVRRLISARRATRHEREAFWKGDDR